MITLKNYVCSFLENKDKMLLMKKSSERKFNPEYWSGLGGNIEPNEINNPLKACYREIYEESGIKESDITSLNLLYIMHNKSKEEIFQSYIYFGESTKVDVLQSEEGVLHWISTNRLLSYRFTLTYIEMMKHYLNRDKDDKSIYFGIAGEENDTFVMNWIKCSDIYSYIEAYKNLNQ